MMKRFSFSSVMADSLQTNSSSHACNGLISSAYDPSTTIDNVNRAAATNNNGVTTITSGSGSIIERARIDDQDNENFFKSLPPGYRFCPTDSELIVDYLNKKIMNERLPRHRIHEVNIYKYSPENLSEIYPLQLGEQEWYFFTPRDRKYLNGSLPSRAAGTGFWKATAADRPIKNDKGSTIGFRKALVFYEGKPPNDKKTSWIMHEFTVKTQPRERTSAGDMRLDDYVLCRIYKKSYKSQKLSLYGDDYSQVQQSPPLQLPVKRNYSQVNLPPLPLPVADCRDQPQVLPPPLPVQGSFTTNVLGADYHDGNWLDFKVAQDDCLPFDDIFNIDHFLNLEQVSWNNDPPSSSDSPSVPKNESTNGPSVLEG